MRIELPPLNSLRAGQWDTIYTDVKVIPSFDEYRNKGNDILEDWSLIEDAVVKQMQFKAEEAKHLLRIPHGKQGFISQQATGNMQIVIEEAIERRIKGKK